MKYSSRELREQRGEVVGEMEQLCAHPPMTKEQRSRWEHLDREQERLRKQIAEAEREEARGAEVIDNGQRVEASFAGQKADSQWVDARTGKPVRVLAPTEKLARPSTDGEQLGFGRYCRAMVLGAKDDAEKRALLEGTDSAGGYTVPTFLAANIIDNIRAQAVCVKAGARTVPMPSPTFNIAKVTGDPQASWRGEGDPLASDDAVFGRVQFIARALSCVVKVSRELLEDSANLDQLLPGVFAKAIALEVDRVALVGSGTPPEPQGLSNAGLGSVDLAGAGLDSYDPVIDAIQLLRAANAGEPTAAIMNPRTLTTFDKLKDNTNQPLRRPPSIERLPFLSTTQIPINLPTGSPVTNDGSLIFVGDFAQMLLGVRTELRIEVLRERYMADEGMYAFLCWFRGDVQLAHDESFAIVEGVN